MAVVEEKRVVPIPTRLARFAELVGRRRDIPLAEATLEIARDEYRDLDVANYLARIDSLVEAASRLDPGPAAPVRSRLQALNRLLFQEEEFHGPGHDHTADPRSSYLNEVLDRRTGLPIALSVIYLEVGRRVGLDLVGVGMPAHFIVRLRGADPPLFIDPFHGGDLLGEAECQKLLKRVTKGRLEMQPEYLLPWSPARILGRILHNLKSTYVQMIDFRRARRVVDLILILRPSSADQIRDRGMLAYQCLLFAEALEDLEHYLALAPRGKDAAAIRAHVQSLRRLIPSSN